MYAVEIAFYIFNTIIWLYEDKLIEQSLNEILS